MTRHARRWLLFAIAPPVFVLFVALGGWIVMQLWNWLMPALFQLPAVTFWQALGLLALTRILVGGVGAGRHGGLLGTRRRRAARWETLTPEERERVRQSMRARCGLDADQGQRA
jgi:hypothetical protein